MIEIVRYTPAHKTVWDNFNASAKNGTMLFYRDYMEYHQNRFKDHSLLFYHRQALVAVLPMNAVNNEVLSHAGLTFGGLIINARISLFLYLDIFQSLLEYLRSKNFIKLTYKTVPFIFHQVLALEDQYALFRCNARLLSRNVSSCIDLQNEIYFTKGRKWSLKKALKAGLKVQESLDYDIFMDLVRNILQNKYKINPTHTTSEIEYLAQKFPNCIKLLAVYKDKEMIGGSIIYIHKQVVHLQYIATNKTGKDFHALDLIINDLIAKYKKDKKYINFGISPGSDEYGLNKGLLLNKESFGAQTILHDVYELSL